MGMPAAGAQAPTLMTAWMSTTSCDTAVFSSETRISFGLNCCIRTKQDVSSLATTLSRSFTSARDDPKLFTPLVKS